MSLLAYRRTTCLLVAAMAVNFAWADMVHPPYAAERCLKNKPKSAQALRACCDDELEGVKRDVAECVRIANEKLKSGADQGNAGGTSKTSGTDRDRERSIEARTTCERLGVGGDKKRLEDCCRNNVPTQARQADEDKYTAICMKAKPAAGAAAPASAKASETATTDKQQPAGAQGQMDLKQGIDTLNSLKGLLGR